MPTALPPKNSTPLPEELLHYLSVYRVVVCTACRYAIQPKAIARHLKEIHRIKRSDRQSFMQYVEQFELAEHELVMQYTPTEFPVPMLPVQSGLQCTSEDCVYLCVTEKRMKRHWLSAHGRQGLPSYDWQRAPVQTFFKGNLLRYFTATPSGKSAEKITAQIIRQDTTGQWAERLPDASFSSTPSSITSLGTLNESDSLIMEYFTTHTWLTLASDEDTRKMWRVTVPQLAYQHKFLMHALLACAALHMAYINPGQHLQLTIKARIHQDHAMPLFRAAIPRVDKETCDAVLIFARLIAVTAFALDERLFRAEEKADKLPSWLFFIRSGCNMLCDVWDQIGTGSVRYLVGSWEVLVDISACPDQSLLNYFMAIPSDDWPNDEQRAYSDSAIALARTFSCMHALDENEITTLDVVRFWLIQNTVEYVELLSNWHPGALILLAHYCVVLHRAGKKSWYFEGKAASILFTIVQRLDLTWHRFIEWPLDEVGLQPTNN